jgi:hypothetical protein
MLTGFPSIEARFRAVTARAMGIDPVRFASPGTLVIPAADREGSAMAALYRIGELTVAWCDPAVAEHLVGIASQTESFPHDGIEQWAADLAAEYVGGAWSHLGSADMLATPEPPPGYDLRVLDREDAADRTLIEGLIDVCGEDDLEASEIAMDDLDPLIIGITGEGRLAGLASARPWDHDAEMGDIGVLVRPDQRVRGLGSAAVGRLNTALFDQGSLPLYRCNFDRLASRGLALSLGFREVSALAAVRFG